eukprot:scaffold10313_cov73-Skeletonema_marinoi.AAC.1
MALDWVSAVGSTGSLISSEMSADVRGVSMVEDEEFMEKELIVEAKNLLTRKEEGEVVAVSKEMAVFNTVATYTNTTLGRNTLILQKRANKIVSSCTISYIVSNNVSNTN